MKTVYHEAATRGTANHGWLQSKHTFSFASYHNPERMNFGVLRVLNDDSVSGGQGFGAHPHQNMEIISIPLSGDLEHKDSMGNTTVIRSGDVQIMSAGTGVTHSEYNKNADEQVDFLQIWVIPNKRDVTPRYDQKTIQDFSVPNTLNQIVSPNKNEQGVWIHQDAWFHIGEFTENTVTNYTTKKPGNGVYIFVLEGTAKVEETTLTKRDGLGIWDTNSFDLAANANSKILVMEIPMRASL